MGVSLPFVAVPLFGESISLLGGLGIALVVLSLWAVTTDGRIDTATLRSRGALLAYLTLATTVGYSLVDKEAMRILGEAPWSSPLPRSMLSSSSFPCWCSASISARCHAPSGSW